MKIIAAPNAFKGSLSAVDAAEAIRQGIHQAFPTAEVICVPVADGGDGLVNVALDVFSGQTRSYKVTGPDFTPITAALCHAPSKNLAAIEMALASGLALLPDTRRDPTRTTTLGTGELIKNSLDLKIDNLLIGIGGSATNDGGIGAAQALGYRFLDERGKPVIPTGANLAKIDNIDGSRRDRRLDQVHIQVACDVDNPLTGPDGAAHVYARQKGATDAQVELLDHGLAHLAEVIKKDLDLAVASLPGAGAAGGLGAGLFAFLGATLRSGVDLIFDLVQLESQIQGADLVITGEGQIDYQTVYGKAPVGVAACAAKHDIPCIALAGSIGEIGALHEQGLDAVFTLCQGPVSLAEAMENGKELLAKTAEQAVRCFFAKP